MPFFPPLKSFLAKRYLFLAIGAFTVLIQEALVGITLKYFLIYKYGKDYLSARDKYNLIEADLETFEWVSLLFFPALFIVITAIYFRTPKENITRRTNLLYFLLSAFLILIYTWFFTESVMLYILPAMMVIGFFSTLKAGFEEAQRVFILLFLALVLALATNLGVGICFS